ncbi:TatD family hydrolase [Vulgatibacter sp.]|uniref:TatD family hydrolase n=1 Tax=Vulgatibacter sp. TaxID=1971226 RepID=UPI00356213EC
MELFDTHCHLDRPEFDADRDALLTRARAAGVGHVLVPAIGPAWWDGLLALVEQGGGHLSCGLGIHPQEIPTLDPADDDRSIRRLGDLLEAGHAVAVGECGLDAPTAENGGSMERQVRLLEAQLGLARDLELPVILHVFRCQGEAVRVLERFGKLPAGGVLHSYSGSAELVKRWSRLDLHFSFTGPVTFERSRRIHEAARAVPADRLLLESDAPDQPPAGHRGERNEPAFLPEVARALAALRGEDAEELAARTTLNARRLFGY